MSAERSAGLSGGRFVQINVDFLRDTTLGADARWLGCVLATFADFARVAFPGLGMLRKVTGLGINRLKAARAELVERGYIWRVQSRAKRARFGTVRYKITTRILHPPKTGPSKDASAHRENGRGESGQEAHEYRV